LWLLFLCTAWAAPYCNLLLCTSKDSTPSFRVSVTGNILPFLTRAKGPMQVLPPLGQPLTSTSVLLLAGRTSHRLGISGGVSQFLDRKSVDLHWISSLKSHQNQNFHAIFQSNQRCKITHQLLFEISEMKHWGKSTKQVGANRRLERAAKYSAIGLGVVRSDPQKSKYENAFSYQNIDQVCRTYSLIVFSLVIN